MPLALTWTTSKLKAWRFVPDTGEGREVLDGLEEELLDVVELCLITSHKATAPKPIPPKDNKVRNLRRFGAGVENDCGGCWVSLRSTQPTGCGEGIVGDGFGGGVGGVAVGGVAGVAGGLETDGGSIIGINASKAAPAV